MENVQLEDRRSKKFNEDQKEKLLATGYVTEVDGKLIDLCVNCRGITPYEITTPVYLRVNYVEGAGQLCEKCGQKHAAN
jgi:hypothetical protein